jgi:cytidine deaminase
MLRNQFDKDHKVLWWKIMEIMKTDNSGLTHSSGAVVAEESIICAMLMGRIINCQNVFLRDRDENFALPCGSYNCRSVFNCVTTGSSKAQ